MSGAVPDMTERLCDLTIIIRGAGEMASGTAWRLNRSGFRRILMTEVDHPLAVRRKVSFCEALRHGTWTVEGVVSGRISDPSEAVALWKNGMIPVLVDPDNASTTLFEVIGFSSHIVFITNHSDSEIFGILFTATSLLDYNCNTMIITFVILVNKIFENLLKYLYLPVIINIISDIAKQLIQ